MMRSMYSAVSALRAHQTRMDVIGNNIANVNTPGYKTSKATFATAFSQTLSGAGASSTDGRGGTNPQQVGLGANLSSITTYHRQGGTQRTDNQTDLMIGGKGYFVLSPNGNGEDKYYTRAGNFIVDRLGYLVSPAGYKVLDKDMKPIQINQSKTKEAEITKNISLKGNIDFNAKVDEATKIAYTSTVDVYDSVGNTHTLSVDFGKKYETPAGKPQADSFSFRAVRIKGARLEGGINQTMGTLTPIPAGTAGTGTTIFGDPAANPEQAQPVLAKFDYKGDFVGFVNNITLDANGFVTNTGTVIDLNDPANHLKIGTSGSEDIEINLAGNPSEAIDGAFKNLSHYKQATNIANTAINGGSAGTIKGFTIAANGDVIGSFTNGKTETLARITLADFDNPSGLLSAGGNMFTETINSGTPKFGTPTSGSFGELTPGALEMSNVDLSAEFTDMITTQRGFQANSRVVTTSDEILQELVNLKR